MPGKTRCCRICGGTELASILSLGDQYLTGVFPRDPAAPLTRGPLELLKCHAPGGCGLVQLSHSFEAREMYGANYGYRSGLNRSMVDHLRETVTAVRRRFPVARGDLVLDIGSNDGTLLSFYPPGPTRVGIDPSAEKFRQFYEPGIEIVPDFFSADLIRQRYGGKKAKVITSIAMFYDLEKPIEFVRQIAEVLAVDGVWYLEQSYMPTMLEVNAYDTICHEHLEYYALRQIKWMTDRCGLRIVDVAANAVNGGSFAVTVALEESSIETDTATVARWLEKEESGGYDTLAPYEEFRKKVLTHRASLRDLLAELTDSGASILGYGASTKGNVILQFCDIGPEQLPAIAEVNTDKFGRFTPGTHIPIISETEAHRRKPDYFLAMPWHFRDNLVQRERAFLERGGKMIFPLPEIEVVAR